MFRFVHGTEECVQKRKVGMTFDSPVIFNIKNVRSNWDAGNEVKPSVISKRGTWARAVQEPDFEQITLFVKPIIAIALHISFLYAIKILDLPFKRCVVLWSSYFKIVYFFISNKLNKHVEVSIQHNDKVMPVQ